MTDEEDQQDELVLTIDDAVVDDEEEEALPEQQDNATVRRMRARIRELEREKNEIERAAPKEQPIDLGPRPRLEDFDYDEDKHNAAVDAWHDAKFDAKRRAEEAEARRNTPDPSFQEDLGRYEKGKATLTAPDATVVLSETEAALTPVMKAAIVKVADDPAALMYRIGTDPALFDRLEAITDPVRLIAAVARLETGTPTMSKKPALDVPVNGKPPRNEGADKKLARLEAEAERTGNRTALVNYKRSLRAA